MFNGEEDRTDNVEILVLNNDDDMANSMTPNSEFFTTKWKWKETAPLIALNMMLPSVDIYSDLYMIVKLFENGHPKWACLLIAPFLLNYLLSWLIWKRLATKRNFSWLPVLFSCYPQYCAAKIIYFLWKDPEKGIKEKNKFHREVSEIEVFAEAVPTTLMMTFLAVQGLLNEGDPARLKPGSVGALIIGEDYCPKNETYSAVDCNNWYIAPDYYMFFVAYSTSIVSASLGLAKCLKVGPCRVLAGSGFCSTRFLLLFLSMGFTLDSKAAALGFALGDPNLSVGSSVGLLAALSTMFLPGFLLAMASLCHYKLCPRDVLAHPSLLFLPIVTNYTFSATRKGETRVKFSRKWTFANLGLSLLGHLIYGLVVYLQVQGMQVPLTVNGNPHLVAWRYYVYSTPVPVLGFGLTLLFLLLDSCCSCYSCSPNIEHAVLKPSDSLVEYVEENSNGRKNIVKTDSIKSRK